MIGASGKRFVAQRPKPVASAPPPVIVTVAPVAQPIPSVSASSELAPVASESPPRGALAEEREAMRVHVLVQLGRSEQAKRVGGAFRARFPNSLMSSSVEAALAAVAPTP